jgi:tRNA 2-thiouridine synthesizing protein A
MDWTRDIDAAGLLCPLPVLRARKALVQMAPGEVLRLVSTDPAAAIDLPHFCASAGHEILGVEREGAASVWFVRRGPDQAG